MTGRLFVVLSLTLLASGCGDGPSSRSLRATSVDTARVTRVVDGDTIRVRLQSGATEKVRYIGIDTPESVKPDGPIECFGNAAAARNGELVAGEEVRLESDAERRDRFGRLLAYVYRVEDDLFVNAELVRGGYATPFTIAPNVTHADEFRRLAAAARAAGRGLWSACGS